MIRVADYMAKRLADSGVKCVFMVTGGGAMFLNHALGSEPRLRCVFNHHEQASAMAAEGYARVTGGLGVINVTSGPGGINALNGVFGAWTDSIPMLVLSGQVKRETLLTNAGIPGLRQLGDQEADILPMVKGITKYAVQVSQPESIRYHLERAMALALGGRPGPCWLDIPIDVQSSLVDEAALPPYDSAEDDLTWDLAQVRLQCEQVLERLRLASRPVILAGSGVRHAGAVELFQQVARRLGIPVTTAWTHDLIASDDPLFCGRPGTIGTRAGNFTVQNSDVLLVIGSRLNIRQVSYNWRSFAHHAFKIQVDIDPAELSKPTVRPDLAIHCDARLFLDELEGAIQRRGWDPQAHAGWLAWCQERGQRYPAVTPAMRQWRGAINPYQFIETLFENLAPEDVVVTGNGAACIVTFQAARLQAGQRLFSNSGAASMGWDLPAAIGAALAQEGGRVICLAGDGSLQLNIQELQTLAHHRLNLKLFVLNNGGYLSIRSTQRNFFDHLVGESPASGLTFPDAVKVGGAYGLPATRLHGADFAAALRQVLAAPGPALCEVMLDPQQGFEPRISSRQLPDGRIVSTPLEDMYPFLEREELAANMLVEPYEAGV
ncbi:MAG: thiamine pyrophosphate-binding protein [Anaerolineales bacterium]|nr:thiamine pyrophosphate-binding protein [Anaerolineales bacterium]